MSLFRHRHLLGTEGLSADDLTTVLDLSERFLEIALRPIKKVPTLRGKTVINLFLEPSTRTRTSFEIAAKRLSADAINISGAASSTVKGETLLDTACNLDAMAPDVVVIRHAQAGAAEMLAKRIAARVVNAGDGAHEHPTQALLDCSTIRAHKGRVAGLEVAICGDITHSRVARSNVLLLRTLGARVTMVSPPTLMPSGVGSWPCETSWDLDAVLSGKAYGDVDAVMMLRVQRERMSGGYFPTEREYAIGYGLSPERVDLLGDEVPILHPGPMNRGLEISSAAADSINSVVLDQVRAGVSVRMAVLFRLLAGADSTAAEDVAV
jgi:aspartate carbamoyltransferase catalytic subunit